MSFTRKVLLVIIALLVSTSGMIVPAQAEKAKALFLYWRGETPCEKGLKNGLKEQNIDVDITEFNAGQDKEKLQNYLASVDESNYDFIYTFGTTVSLETAKVIKNKPVLFGIVTNPVASGLIASWESSGNNVTGVSHAIPYKDQVDFILKLGSYKQIGIVYDQNAANAKIANDELDKILSAHGVTLVSAPVASANDLDGALSTLIDKKVDLVYLPSDSLIIANADKILQKINSSNIATYCAVESLIEKGGMVGIVGSYEMVGKLLAGQVAKILKGQPPAEIPSSYLPAAMQTIVVNAKTAKQINAPISYEILSVAKVLE